MEPFATAHDAAVQMIEEQLHGRKRLP